MIARIRTVKPELFQHGSLYDLEVSTGLPLRVAFIALWSLCDREGRFEWKPREMKLSALPYDPVDFARVLDALATGGFVVRYAAAGREYGWVPRFLSHQQINNRETASVLPPPPDDLVKAVESGGYSYTGDAWVTRGARVKDASLTPHKGKGTEQNRTEQNVTPPSGGWPAEFAGLYEKVGLVSPGQIGRILKPVVDHYGLDRAREMWGYYIRHAPSLRFGKLEPGHWDTSRMSPADFVKNAGTWYAKTQPIGGGDAATAS